MALREDLIAAKALIADPAKWLKGDYEDNGRFCPLGAGQAVNGLQEGGPEYYRALRSAIPAWFEPDESDWAGDVPQFNDDPDTTHADIMTVFDTAIAAAEVQP